MKICQFFIEIGENGCGKMDLINQLMKIISNGEYNVLITEVIEVEEKNFSRSNMICILYEEINKTSFFSKMKELFVNYSLNGKAINEIIKIKEACNPFRKREET